MKRPARTVIDLHREQLVDIGPILKEAREALGLTPEEIAAKTLIRATLLRAIEAAEVQLLPEPVYTRGLIRQYANTLGLDGDTLSSQYFTPPIAKATRSFWRLPITPQLRPLHLYLVYVAVIATAVSGLSHTLRQASYRSTPPLPPLSANDMAAAQAEPEATPAPLPHTSGETMVNAPVRVLVEMQGQSWLRITADGDVSFEGVLQQGESRVWTADERLVIRAGNAGGVMVSFNDGDAQSLGQPGMVTEVVFPPAETAALLRP